MEASEERRLKAKKEEEEKNRGLLVGESSKAQLLRNELALGKDNSFALEQFNVLIKRVDQALEMNLSTEKIRELTKDMKNLDRQTFVKGQVFGIFEAET